jgi:hypothetical protein
MIHEVPMNFIETIYEGNEGIMGRSNVNQGVVNKGIEGLLLPWTC